MTKEHAFSTNLNNEQEENIRTIFPNFFKNKSSKFKLSIEDISEPDILYHYTSMSTLHAILDNLEMLERENTNCFVLRGTHVNYLNDNTELKRAVEILHDELKKHEDELPENENKHITNDPKLLLWITSKIMTFFNSKTLPFITSFSENKDNLPMWNTYGNEGTGVAIGVKTIKQSENHSIYHSKCIYDKSHFIDILKTNKIAQKTYKIYNPQNAEFGINPNDGLIGIAQPFSQIKHPAYEYEQEYRFIKCYQKNSDEIKYTEKNSIIKPFVEHYFPKDIVKEIIIGPTANKDLSIQSLEMRLKKAGFATHDFKGNKNPVVSVQSSNIPYRSI